MEEKRSFDRAFFIGVIYGVIFGIIGNILVELLLQVFYPSGIDKISGMVGIVLCTIVLALGIRWGYTLSKILPKLS